MKIELGLTSFADNMDLHTEVGTQPGISNAQRIRNIIEEVETADQYGLDVYGLGEHHRPDYAVSDPDYPQQNRQYDCAAAGADADCRSDPRRHRRFSR